MEGLEFEWQKNLHLLKEKKILTIYFGGGTPTLLGPSAIGKILSWIRKDSFFAVDSPEITIEANPENITFELMRSYADLGINRLSIGMQTLDNQLLKQLGRLHDGQKAIDAVETAYNAGITNISIDLMYDLPNQNLLMWQNTLKRASELPIAHLSLYNLTIEPHTVFFKNKETLEKLLPDQETSLQMYESAIEILSKNEFEQYEISAFARSNQYSRHNSGYWIGRPFLGFGPSAFSYWEKKRFRNIANLSQYHRKLKEGNSPIDFEETLPGSAQKRELLAIQLRLIKGVDLEEFQKRHGLLDSETIAVLDKLHSEGFLRKKENLFSLTKQGILFYDSLAVELI